MVKNYNQQAFFELVRAGLWEKDVWLLSYGEIDFSTILEKSVAQGVVGLIAAGLDHVLDMKPPKKDVLQFIGRVTQIEQRNMAMNFFIGVLVDQMREANINTVLVKGQGVAQCFERPLCRPSGDIDFLVSQDNYEKAKEFLMPLSSGSKAEGHYSKHVGINIDPWYVEIHGTLRTGLSRRVDRMVDHVQDEVFRGGNVRSWMNDSTRVILPAPTEDVFLVFTHFIKHLYKKGVCLRQICDWVRLLWTYQEEIDTSRLESWVKQAGLMTEWKIFAALAVEYLGMPVGTMPFYDGHSTKQAALLVSLILDKHSGSKFGYTCDVARIFPRKTFIYLPSIFLNLNWLKVKERVMG